MNVTRWIRTHAFEESGAYKYEWGLIGYVTITFLFILYFIEN